MKEEIVNVTPRLANKWLYASKFQDVDMDIVHGFVQSIASGTWEAGKEEIPIVVVDWTWIREGYHRLRAVIQAGISTPMKVRFEKGEQCQEK